MSQTNQSFSSDAGLLPEFSAEELINKGMQLFDENDYEMAHRFFKQAFQKDAKPETKILLDSYYGFTLAYVEKRDEEGIRLMRSALNQEFYRADFFINLGRIYWIRRKDRKKALNTYYHALRYHPNHPKIMAILNDMGRRKKPVCRFLRRGNPVNVWLGRRRNQKTKLQNRGRKSIRQQMAEGSL